MTDLINVKFFNLISDFSREKVFYENENSVDTNYTLTTNFNAVSAGPVTVASGVTVTIPAGQAWVIV